MKLHLPSLALALSVALPTASLALETPTPSKFDPHMRTAPYRAGDRVLLEDTLGRSLTITFSPKEHIALVIFGDSLANGSTPAWEGPDQKQLANQSLGNVLPLWPLRPGQEDMQVITKDDVGERKVYQFELVAMPAPAASDPCSQDDCDDPNATYGLTFTYPDDVRAAQIAAWRASQAQRAKQLAEDRLATDIFSGPRNWKYMAQGKDKNLAPTEVSDNGRVTAFRFVNNTEIPAIYAVTGKGLKDERLLAWSMQDDMVVVQETDARFRLRLGSEVLDIINEGYVPGGINYRTGTVSASVIREIKAPQ